MRVLETIAATGQRSWSLLFVGLLTVITAVQGNETVDQRSIKAAFLYNFARYIEWPSTAFASPHSPLTICIVGNDPFGPAINEITDKIVNSRALEISNHKSLPSKNCHILYIANATDAENIKLPMPPPINTLTVSDIPNFAEQGGNIEIVQLRERIRFRINRTSAIQANLVVNARLLNLALEVLERGSE